MSDGTNRASHRLRPGILSGHEQAVATVGFQVRHLVLSGDAGRRPGSQL